VASDDRAGGASNDGADAPAGASKDRSVDGAGASADGAEASKDRAGGGGRSTEGDSDPGRVASKGAGSSKEDRPFELAGSSNENPKSRSESDSTSDEAPADAPPPAAPDPAEETGVGVPPNRSRNGESISSVVSTEAARGRTGCGAWKTPTAPCPGAVTNSSTGSLVEESDGA
jgi:hypothetical protein